MYEQRYRSDNRNISSSRQSGFTVIEVVVAIILVGIVSAVAMSRMLRSDTYDPVVTRDQVISMSRSAQQKAIGRKDVALYIQPFGDELEIRIQDESGVVQRSRNSIRNVILTADVNNVASCANPAGTAIVSNATPLVIQYDLLGNILRGGVSGTPGYPQDITSAVRLCVNGDPVMSICWSPSGYAYTGNCIP